MYRPKSPGVLITRPKKDVTNAVVINIPHPCSRSRAEGGEIHTYIYIYIHIYIYINVCQEHIYLYKHTVACIHIQYENIPGAYITSIYTTIAGGRDVFILYMHAIATVSLYACHFE